MRCFVILIICFAALGMSCVTYHRYHVVPWESELSGGTITLEAGQCFGANSDAFNYEPADSGNVPWCLSVCYRPDTLALSDIELDLDSVSYMLSDSFAREYIAQDQWERTVYGNWSCIIIGPISLPVDYRSDFTVDFILSVFDGGDVELVDKRHFNVEVRYSKGREFYWGR